MSSAPVCRSLVIAVCLVGSGAAPVGAAAPEAAPRALPRPDFHFEGKVGKTYLQSDPPQFPEPVAVDLP